MSLDNLEIELDDGDILGNIVVIKKVREKEDELLY